MYAFLPGFGVGVMANYDDTKSFSTDPREANFQ